jgi:multiple sugar transport system ATP-binding protein
VAEIRFEHITKRFGSAVAVNDLNLTVHDHELLTLVGPSGCGKSTTLNILAGLEDPSEGLIYIDNRLVNEMPPGARDIAMVFQSYALYPHMTVRQNIGFGLKVRGMGKQEIERRVVEAAEVLGIGDLLNRRPKELSGGQRQRVALGRALTRDPKAFLLDEPLSNLDAQLRTQMRAELKILFARLQGTVVYVTHDQAEAMTLSDRLVVMRDGVVQQVGTPLEVYNRPNNMFVAKFLGSPSMNFVSGELQAQPHGDGLDVVAPNFRFALNGTASRLGGRPSPSGVVLGVRPEDVAVSLQERDDALGCRVEVTEAMGSSTIVYATTGHHRIVASTEPDIQVRSGDSVWLTLNRAKVQFFDAATEQNLLLTS